MTYPFTAVVGQDEARLALLLCAELENTYADIEGTIEEVSDDPAIAPNTRVGAPPQNPAGGLDLSELGLI